MTISFKHSGSFKNTERFFERAKRMNIQAILHKYGSAGVSALSNATPVDTGVTANSWSYVIGMDRGGYSIEWHNTNAPYGAVVAILLQYGHGTGTGGYVRGRDYINPAMRPIFDGMVNDIWKEVNAL